jgi:hypothetical protein
MRKLASARGKQVANRRSSRGNCGENRKKMLNRENEPKDLLKTKHLAFFAAKNEPKTNWFLNAKMGKRTEKGGQKCGKPKTENRN